MVRKMIIEFYYSVFEIPERYFLKYLRGNWRKLKFHLISAINFYYIINKLIILIPDLH
jgi:hypothetical protein